MLRWKPHARSKMNAPPVPVCEPMRVSSSRYVSRYSDPNVLSRLLEAELNVRGSPARNGTNTSASRSASNARWLSQLLGSRAGASKASARSEILISFTPASLNSSRMRLGLRTWYDALTSAVPARPIKAQLNPPCPKIPTRLERMVHYRERLLFDFPNPSTVSAVHSTGEMGNFLWGGIPIRAKDMPDSRRPGNLKVMMFFTWPSATEENSW